MQPKKAKQSEQVRKRIFKLSLIILILALAHQIDHVIRGSLIENHHLDPNWNHSGWPFLDVITPFTFIVPIILAVISIGLYLTIKTDSWPRYWLANGIILTAVVGQVHFLSGSKTESPNVIYLSYTESINGPLGTILGLLGNLLLLAIFIALGWIIYEAYKVTRDKF